VGSLGCARRHFGSTAGNQAAFVNASDMFDAAGPAVKAFNTWDRSRLINKYGAHFYHEAPSKVVLALMKTDKGWQIATE